MGGKRKKPAIPKVFKPRVELVDETQGWVKKRARLKDVPQEIQEETKEEIKTVRPDVRAYYPIYSDTPGAWQADLMFIPYTNLKKETRLHAFLCLVNINTKWAFVRQCNYDAKKIRTQILNPKMQIKKCQWVLVVKLMVSL